jgi:hypothetical protein
MITAKDDFRHTLTPGTKERESLLYIICLPEHGIGAWAYTWVNSESEAGLMVVVYGAGPGALYLDYQDNIPISREMDLDNWQLGGLHISHTKALEQAEVRYANGDVRFEIDFDASAPAFDYNTNPSGCPPFLGTERYEQAARVRGRLSIPELSIDLDTTAHRDHCWGPRIWDEPLGYRWFIAQAGTAISLNAMTIQYKDREQVCGFVARDGVNSPIVAADIDQSFDDELRQTEIRTRLTTEDGAVLTFDGQRASLMEFIWGDGQCVFVETSLACTLDGLPGVGHAEYMWAVAEHHNRSGGLQPHDAMARQTPSVPINN